MARYSERRVDELASEELCGYVLKKDSPSCGLHRVRVYGAHGVPTKSGRGIFATRLVERFPSLPVEEEGRLSDPRLRENFVERVFAYSRLRNLFRSKWNVGALVAFHTAHKLILMAHSTDAYQRLGRLVAGARGVPPKELERTYTEQFMAALTTIATARRHTNVLQHMIGYLKDRLDRASQSRAACRHRRLPHRPRAAHRSDHAAAALCPSARRVLPGRPVVSRATPEGADAAQSRLTLAGGTAKKVKRKA